MGLLCCPDISFGLGTTVFGWDFSGSEAPIMVTIVTRSNLKSNVLILSYESDQYHIYLNKYGVKAVQQYLYEVLWY